MLASTSIWDIVLLNADCASACCERTSDSRSAMTGVMLLITITAASNKLTILFFM